MFALRFVHCEVNIFRKNIYQDYFKSPQWDIFLRIPKCDTNLLSVHYDIYISEIIKVSTVIRRLNVVSIQLVTLPMTTQDRNVSMIKYG